MEPLSPSPATETPPQKRQAGIETSVRIREAASELFFRSGYHATTMRQIAAASGVRAGSVYNHYQNKEDLLYRIAHDTMEEMVEGGTAAVDDATSPTERLRAFVEFHVTYCIERRFQARVADDFLHVLAPEPRKSVIALRDRYETILRTILTAGAAEESWQIPDIAIASFAFVTMITDVRLWYRPDGRLTLAEVVEVYCDLILRALAAPLRPG
jgi:AcrR family transcriptional regulator